MSAASGDPMLLCSHSLIVPIPEITRIGLLEAEGAPLAPEESERLVVVRLGRAVVAE